MENTTQKIRSRNLERCIRYLAENSDWLPQQDLNFKKYNLKYNKVASVTHEKLLNK